jgi:hypothetical protein
MALLQAYFSRLHNEVHTILIPIQPMRPIRSSCLTNSFKFAMALTLASSLFSVATPSESLAQTTPASATATVRIRGAVMNVTTDTLTVKDRSGEVIEFVLPY